MHFLSNLVKFDRLTSGRVLALVSLLGMLVLSACQAKPTRFASTPISGVTQTPSLGPRPTPLPTPSASLPKRTLVACLGEEPASLYIYGPVSYKHLKLPTNREESITVDT